MKHSELSLGKRSMPAFKLTRGFIKEGVAKEHKKEKGPPCSLLLTQKKHVKRASGVKTACPE